MTSIRIGTALSSLFNHHLRSVGFSIIVTPRHSEPSSHNQSSSAGQCSWEGGKGSPGCRPREEGQHRRKVLGSVESSGNHKSLHTFHKFKLNVDWTGPTSERAAQAWPNLFSGSWGSSSTKPLMLYLQLCANEWTQE